MPITEHRLFGPPGTGKTTKVSEYIHTIATRYGPRAVLVASFTKAAAEELVMAMGKKAKRRYEEPEDFDDPFEDGHDEEEGGRNRLPIDRQFVGTLHAICFRALTRPEIAESHLADWNATHRNLGLTEGGTPDPEDGNAGKNESGESTTKQSGDDLYARMNLLRARLVPVEMWPESVQGFRKQWEDWKYQSDLVDFTDLIGRCLRDVNVAPGSPYFGIFDEVQDFTPMELALVRKWAEHMEYIVFAGDDDQTLYRFTGATPDAFLDPPVPDAQKHVLSQSHRVPRAVQRVAQTWIERVSRRELKPYLPREEEGFVRKAPTGGTWRTPERLLDLAMDHVSTGQTVMFLAACSYMLEPIKHLLRDQGLPFFNPYRRKRGDWNPLGGSRGVSSSDRVLSFLRSDHATHGEGAQMWTCDDVFRWASVLQAKGVLRKGMKSHLEELQGIYRPVSLETLEAIFEDTATMGWDMLFDGPDLEWYERHLVSAKVKPMEFPLRVARKRGGKALTERPKIILGTIHSVKGGEADVVFMFPDLSRAGMQEWGRRGEPRDSIYRLQYVGMTRAIEGLYLCSPATAYTTNLLEVL